MKRLLIALLAVAPIVSTFAQDKKMPEVNVTALDGSSVEVKNFIKSDKITVISFWATWCSPCKKELDAISEVYEDWKKDYNVELIAMSIDDARAFSKVKPLVESKGWSYTVLVDKNEDLKRALNIDSVPYTIVVDKEGKIVYEHSGYKPGDEDELEAVLSGLVK